ncbi:MULTISPECIES: hypothetical protein [unclassified Streptomyces]|jgi:hypothetical protein
MGFYLGIPVVLLAVLLAASGVAAITRGWVLPWTRKAVRRTRLHGWAQLAMAAALCCQVGFGLMVGDLGARQAGTLGGSVLMLAGILLMAASQRAPGGRPDSPAP